MNPTFPWWRLALSAISGLALAFAFPAHSWSLFTWVSLAGLLLSIIGARPAVAALCGFLFGVVLYAVSIPWVATVLQQYGPMPLWLAAGVFLLLVIALSLFPAAFAAAVAWIAQRNVTMALLAAPFLWVAMELGRMYLPQPTVCFPWNLLGYTASGNLALLQLASLTGIWGLSFLVVAYNSLLVWTLRAPGARGMTWFGATTALVCVALAGPHFVPTPKPDHVAHMVQTNLPQALDYPPNWNDLHADDLAELDQISVPARKQALRADIFDLLELAGVPDEQMEEPTATDLVIWPEVPAPFSLQQGDFTQRVDHIAAAARGDFLFGELDWKRGADGKFTPYNSAALVDPAGREEFLYDKIRLVPFGEFIPWRNELFFAKGLTGLIGDFGVGSRYAVGQLQGGSFSVFICYEAIFPNAVRHFVNNGAELLVNISNDGWFGRSAAAAQHLAQARVRAVENRRWLLRDTNTGLTVSVDPYGRIRAQMAPQTRGVLDAPFGFMRERTLYTRWGDWLAYLSVALSACFLIAAGMRATGAADRPNRRNAVGIRTTK